jgi:hypothetical protein
MSGTPLVASSSRLRRNTDLSPENGPRMKRLIITVASLAGAIAVLGVVAVMLGVLPFPGDGDSGRPPCDQLPARQAAIAAIDSHPDLVSRIEGVGSGVSVEVGTPCDDPNLGLVTISYSTDEERAAVHGILRDSNGFGVPAELIRKS